MNKKSCSLIEPCVGCIFSSCLEKISGEGPLFVFTTCIAASILGAFLVLTILAVLLVALLNLNKRTTTTSLPPTIFMILSLQWFVWLCLATDTTSTSITTVTASTTTSDTSESTCLLSSLFSIWCSKHHLFAVRLSYIWGPTWFSALIFSLWLDMIVRSITFPEVADTCASI